MSHTYSPAILVIIMAFSFLIVPFYSSNRLSYLPERASGLFSDLKDDFLTYEDHALGIIIQYPAGWIKEVRLGNLVTFLPTLGSSSNTYPAALGVKVQNLHSRNVTLGTVTKVQIENLTQNYPDFVLLESTSTTLANNPGHKIVFTATDADGHQRRAMQVWMVNGDKAYLITYKALPEKYSEYLPLAQGMIDSFKLKK
jgi:serine/threonine-protein kinase